MSRCDLGLCACQLLNMLISVFCCLKLMTKCISGAAAVPEAGVNESESLI